MSSKHCFLASSPSSGGAESASGTPETRLTPFSSVKSTNDKTTFLFKALSSGPTTFQHGSHTKTEFDATDKDPFISTRARSKYEQSLLSPTASSFQPFALRISQGICQTPMVAKSPGPSAPTHLGKQSAEPFVGAESLSASSPIGCENSPVTQSGTFSTDLGTFTRALKVSGAHNQTQAAAVQACVEQTCGQTKGSLTFVHTGSDVFVRFSDIADAIGAYNYLQTNYTDWSTRFITPASFAEKTNPKVPFVSAHEGQVGLVANFPITGGFDRAKLEGIILDLLSIDGDVYAYQKQLASEAGTFRLIAEYSDVNAATRAVERLNGATVRGINISIAFHKPDINASPRHRGHPSTPTRGRLNLRDAISTFNRMSVASPGMTNPLGPKGHVSVLSPTGRSFVPTSFAVSPQYSGIPLSFGGQFSPVGGSMVGSTSTVAHYNENYPINHLGASGPNNQGIHHHVGSWDVFGSPTELPRVSQLARFNARRQVAPKGSSRSSYNSQVGQHNVVDVDRIRAGLDVRTTIMLRNIPNKIDQSQLKAIVDQTSRGLYDFMYLRIDFANNCNVGYAFINFEDPYHIINFVAARAGQRWNRYSSDKIAEVSYATIQGKDCLVQKFRNSSVMLEHPSFRPKIFHTGNNLRAGEEEDFPLPDNVSKMRRSVENAEHVGLFAPRAGQHYRDEQRRRRSRYDRGTRLAALEEYDYEDYYSIEQELQAQYTHNDGQSSSPL